MTDSMDNSKGSEDPNIPSQNSTIFQTNIDGKKPTCIIVLGMAGSGKTTFVQRLVSVLYDVGGKPYVINLDPACREVPYPANIGTCNIDTFNFITVLFISESY